MEEQIEEFLVNDDLAHRERSLKRILERWKNSPFLEDVEEEFKTSIAVLLDNQKLIMEIVGSEDSSLLDLTAKVFPNLLVNEIASVQPFFGPMGNAYYSRYEEEKVILSSSKVLAYTRKLENNTPDALINEFNKETITDISNNVGTKITSSETLNGLFLVEQEILRKSHQVANWVVINSETSEIFPHASLSLYKVIINDNVEKNTVLVGSKAGMFGCGYVFCPYIPFTPSPVGSLLTRCGKTLISSNHYGKLVINA